MYMPMGVHGPVGASVGAPVGEKWPENSPAASEYGQALGKNDPETAQRGKMLTEAAKRYPKTVQRQAEAASVGQK
jgi:hypothetical protein